MTEQHIHAPVLLETAIHALAIKPDGIYIDATFGRGGHSEAILASLNEQGRLLAIDKDEIAVNYARKKFANDPRFSIVHGSFAELQAIAKAEAIEAKVDGILFDLGVSSPQLDDANRGFSFTHDGPLDMRMNRHQSLDAAMWLQHASEKEIADVLYQYGEERFSRRLAKAVVIARQQEKIVRTKQLADIIKRAHPKWERHKHPATRSFQAIRIFINSELAELQQALAQCIEVLKICGRMVVISFHSLEDRIVKQFIQRHCSGHQLPRHLPLTKEQLAVRLRRIGKAIKPCATEITENIRSRTAILRIAEKLS